MEAATGHQKAKTDLNGLAVSATTHCLTGCAIGEVVGMAIATALGWGNAARSGSPWRSLTFSGSG